MSSIISLGARNGRHDAAVSEHRRTPSIEDRRDPVTSGLAVLADRHVRHRLDDAQPLVETPLEEAGLPRRQQERCRLLLSRHSAQDQGAHVALGVGVTSSVIPYVCDQLAMARLARATYSLLVSLLPATATVIGVVVLAQLPTWSEVLGVALVIGGVALHQKRDSMSEAEPVRT